MKILRWTENGIERTLDYEEVSAVCWDTTKKELRIRLRGSETWRESAITVQGAAAERLYQEMIHSQ